MHRIGGKNGIGLRISGQEGDREGLLPACPAEAIIWVLAPGSFVSR